MSGCGVSAERNVVTQGARLPGDIGVELQRGSVLKKCVSGGMDLVLRCQATLAYMTEVQCQCVASNAKSVAYVSLDSLPQCEIASRDTGADDF